MADTLDKFTRSVKAFYEEISTTLTAGKTGIDRFLFPVEDLDERDSFALDKLVKNIHGVVFRKPGEQSVVRPYEPGVGNVYKPPRVSEKTPVTEDLRDSVIVGLEATDSFSSQTARLLEQILKQHSAAHTATRWKLAIDTIRTGKFTPVGMGGHDIGLEIDFSRDAGCDITYDFTASSVSINTALKALYDAKQGSKGNLVMILGAKWLQEFSDDETVQAYMQANVANTVLLQSVMPSELQNVQGLYVAAVYRIPGTLTPVTICGFQTDEQFVQYSGATAVDFMPDDEAICFSAGATRYRVFRGVDVAEDNAIRRAVGEIVFDSFTEKDPPTLYLRSQARYAMIPANVNHTARSVGTFPAESA